VTTLALSLVVVSAVVHAGWNALVKRHPDPEAAAIVVVAGAAACAALGSVATGEGPPPAAAWPWVLASGGVEAVYFVALGRALARLPLGTAYGVSRGGGQLVTWPVSVVWLGEPVSGLALGGAAVLVAGLAARVRPPFDRAGLGWATACALAIGAYPLTYQQALRAGAPHFVLFTVSLVVALPVQLALLGSVARLRAASSGHGPRLALAAIACAASFLLFLAALGLGGAGRASAVRNVSIAVATALGAASGEVLDRRALAGAALITLGAVAVSAG
jgi:drug/metabolite transporter (DMT)-like permease